MTQNQIAYWNYVENRRHNLATEAETNRNNLQTERLGFGQLEENIRTHRENESISWFNAYENQRKNYVDQAEQHRANVAKEEELHRHHVVTENQLWSELGIKAANLAVLERNATVNERQATVAERNATVNERNATTNERNAASNAIQAQNSTWQARSSWKQAQVAEANYKQTVIRDQAQATYWAGSLMNEEQRNALYEDQIWLQFIGNMTNAAAKASANAYKSGSGNGYSKSPGYAGVWGGYDYGY